VIWLVEKAGWVYDVRRPDAARLAAKQARTTGQFGSMARPKAANSLGR
jgi:hypothetical protein